MEENCEILFHFFGRSKNNDDVKMMYLKCLKTFFF